MTIDVLAFARLRELLGFDRRAFALPPASRVADAWTALCAEHPALAPLRASTRFARNGTIVPSETPLCDGDELALLPPVGGG